MQVPGGYLLSFPKCIPNSVFTVSRLRVSSGLQRVGGCIHVNTMFQPWKMQKKRRCFCAKTQGLLLFVGLNQQPSLNCFILVPVVLQFFGWNHGQLQHLLNGCWKVYLGSIWMYWVKILSNSSQIWSIMTVSLVFSPVWHTNLPWFLTEKTHHQILQKESHLSEGWDGSRTAAFWAASHLKPVVGNAPRIFGLKNFLRKSFSGALQLQNPLKVKPRTRKDPCQPAQWFCCWKTALCSDSHMLWCCFGSLSKDSSPFIRKGAPFCSSQASYQSN